MGLRVRVKVQTQGFNGYEMSCDLGSKSAVNEAAVTFVRICGVTAGIQHRVD